MGKCLQRSFAGPLSSAPVGRAISEVLPFAVGVAVSPIPIIAVILMLFSSRARVNGPAFVLGWVVGLAVLCAAVYAVANAADVSADQDASDTTFWIKLGLGVLLLLAAARNWRKRPAPGTEPSLPKWMTAVEHFTPVKALTTGVVLGAVNPKNLALTIGAAASVAQAGVSTSDAVVALAFFVVLASLATGGTVVLYLVGGERATHVLDGWRAWLSSHGSAVMAVLLLVFGVVLFSQGLRGLTA
jgi:threonine/homoserine/homoserine lactone efflux protein